MPSSQINALFELATPQSLQQPFPPTIASAATIAPVHLVTFITGTVAVGTITPPIEGAHVLILIFTNASPAVLLTSGNIKTATAPVQNVPVIAVYDPATAKYWTGRLTT
jgi:hypothetical protein